MHTAVLPIGGNHLTSDIAAGLRTPISEAERLKITFGVATNQVVRRDEKVVGRAGTGGTASRLRDDRAVVVPTALQRTKCHKR